MSTNIQFWSYLTEFFLEWEFFQIKLVRNINTHILRSLTFSESRAVYELMWKNMVIQYGAWALRAGRLRLQTHSQNM